ncbi:hypothetical protein DRQ25_17115 [Candidatus Fermentibacteria bacterium]|nr:MAG: hypothetical protein DRQ25_17115 [Candidatus Fermentibacteria bacterium]
MRKSKRKRIAMNSKIIYSALSVMIFVLACGGGNKGFDSAGYSAGEDDLSIFTRACQQYFRGSLSHSKETFNTLIYRFPDSHLNSDAQLAVRKIEYELTGISEIPVEDDIGIPVYFPSVAVVGIPSVISTVSQLEVLIITTGTPPLTIEDAGAPDVTLVLYPEGLEEQAYIVSDSLSSWLSSHSSVPVQPGGDIISSVAPSHSGIVIVVGTDAAVDGSLLRSRSLEP